jgi:hypothetical protein
VTPAPGDERARQLLDEAARIYDPLWDDAVAMVRSPDHHESHSARATLAYGLLNLIRGGQAAGALAERAIRAVLALQELNPADSHHGNFRWTLEDPRVRDLNGVEFILDNLNEMILSHGDALPSTLADDVRTAIALGLAEIDRLDVHLSYTNIAVSDISNSVLGGVAVGDATYVGRGERRLMDWLAFTNRSGAPHEYNSPTYCAVDLQRLAALAEHAPDPDLALKARVAEERVWMHVAAHYHPLLRQLAGPHARSYWDGWTGAGGYLKLLLWRLLGDPLLRAETSYAPASREEMYVALALDRLHPTPEALAWLAAKRFPFEVRETVDAGRSADITTYLTENYAFGTASCHYTVGDPPEPTQQLNGALLQFRRDVAPGFGTLSTRFIVDDRDRGASSDAAHGDDLWDEGTLVAAQSRNRAIVAYGLTPRLRPVRSFKLSVRLLGAGPDTEVWCGDRRVDAFPASVQPGEAVVIAEGGVYIAVIPLEPDDLGHDAPIELCLDGHLLTLDIYNYQGPPNTFWEYRSLAGAFFKRNVRNAVILEVAERTNFADLAAFRRHIAAARVSDRTDSEHVREIAYASDGGSVSLSYDLREVRPIARVFDGVPYVAPMSRAGAVDGSGLQWIQSRDSLVELPGATLTADTAPKWLAVDGGARRCLFVHPTVEETDFALEMDSVAVECDAFGFGRVTLDAAFCAVTIEAAGEIGPVRIRSADSPRCWINGTDVTGSLVNLPDGAREFHGR